MTINEDDVTFTQEDGRLYVKLAGAGKYRIVDCAIIDDWYPDTTIVMLKCSNAPVADTPEDKPSNYDKITSFHNGVTVYRNLTTGQLVHVQSKRE